MVLPGSRAFARLSHLSSQCLDKGVSPAWNIARVSAQQAAGCGSHGAIGTSRPTFYTSLPFRLYATNAVSRPKAHTGRTTSAPRKKASTTKASTAGTSERTKKPAAEKAAAKDPQAKTSKAKTSKAKSTTAKAKKKSKGRTRAKSTKARKKSTKAKKPAKAKKRQLTPKQVEEKAKRKQRQTLKDIKEKALTPPKGLPQTAYLVLLIERTQKPGVTVTNASKEISRIYRALSPEEREHYNHIANQNKATNLTRYREWIRSFTPQQIYEANCARVLLKRKTPSPRMWNKLEDERLAARPRNAYSFFLQDRYKSGDFAGMKIGAAGKLIGGEWKALGANEKQAYVQRAEEDMARYEQEVKAVYNRDVQHRAAKAA
ncbi:MAG: hypothetical protein Q9207_007260 [Kuettlingeria erythrocarpa]